MANWGNIEKQTTNNNIETVDDKDLPRNLFNFETFT